MSEIKGQLLGIILVLVIFGTVSVAVAQVFKSSKEKMVTQAGSVTEAAEETISARAFLSYNED